MREFCEDPKGFVEAAMEERSRAAVGRVERSETHHLSTQRIDGFRFAPPILPVLRNAHVRGQFEPISCRVEFLHVASAVPALVVL